MVTLSNGFRHNNTNKCIYYLTINEYRVVLSLYIDDMLIFSTNMKEIEGIENIFNFDFPS